VNVADLHPRRHDPPEGWSAETFERVTDALAAALVAAVRRQNETIWPGVPASTRAGTTTGGEDDGREQR
jgi:hypothetical protein